MRVLGEHPDGGPVQILPGKYGLGLYVKWGKVNATLPKETAPEAVTLEEALALIAERAGKSKKPAKKATKKVATTKVAKKTAKKVTKKIVKKPVKKAQK